MLADVRKTREKGYTVNNEEYVLGLISIGAPLINEDGVVLGAVSFDVSTAQFTVAEAERRLGPAALRLVRQIKPTLPM